MGAPQGETRVTDWMRDIVGEGEVKDSYTDSDGEVHVEFKSSY